MKIRWIVAISASALAIFLAIGIKGYQHSYRIELLPSGEVIRSAKLSEHDVEKVLERLGSAAFEFRIWNHDQINSVRYVYAETDQGYFLQKGWGRSSELAPCILSREPICHSYLASKIAKEMCYARGVIWAY